MQVTESIGGIFKRMFSIRETRPSDIHSRRGFMSLVARTTAKIFVNEKKALSFSAVWAAVRVISDGVSCSPWEVFEDAGNTKKKLTDHPVHRLLRVRPNTEMTSKTFRATLCAHVLLWGNAFAEIERARNGNPIALWPIQPERVTIKRDANLELVYIVTNEGAPPAELSARDILHFKGLSHEGVVGYSVVTQARESIALGMAAESMGAAFFGNDARPAVAFQYPNELGEDERKNLKESIETLYGAAKNSWRPIVLEGGMKIETITMPLQDAQFLETRKFQVTEIARWFRVPPHMLADMERATFTNIEHQGREYIRDTLRNWTVTFEEEVNVKLFSESELGRIFTKINLSELMRPDSKSQALYLKTLFNMGAIDIDEVRAEDGRNPIDGGDLRLVPMNMIPLNQVQENATAKRGNAGGVSNALSGILEETFGRFIHKENAALERKAKSITDVTAFETWLYHFFDLHISGMIESINPIVDSFCKLYGRVDDVTIVAARLSGFLESYRELQIDEFMMMFSNEELDAEYFSSRELDEPAELTNQLLSILERGFQND